MRFFALATDYDNTLASDGRVAESTWAALERLRASGRHVILVSGRELDDLLAICPRIELFSRVVAENGGVLYCPADGGRRLLAPAPPDSFVAELRRRAPGAFSVSQTLIATMKPHEHVALDVIRDLGLELQIVFNGDAVMIVAPGVSKASGLSAALADLDLSPLNVVGIGDAENDHALLAACGLAAAVENALPALKEHADLVTHGVAGAGVAELIDALVADDLRGIADASPRNRIVLGTPRDAPDGEPLSLPVYGSVVLLVGESGCGKSTATAGLLERLAGAGCQMCIVDPEGDYGNDDATVVLGDASNAPSIEEAVQLLCRPARSAVAVNLLRVPPPDRPMFCANLLLQTQHLRTRTGRPQWLVFEEAHHLFPAEWAGANQAIPDALETALAVTVSPEQLSPVLLRQVSMVLAMGDDAHAALQRFAAASGCEPPTSSGDGAHSSTDGTARLAKGDALLWRVGDAAPPQLVRLEPGRKEKRRHRRKYAEGLLIPERSFYFRGQHNALNLRAHNLVLFVEIAEGVDAATWQFHRQRGDYSRWFEQQIGDADLAEEARGIEQDSALDAAQSLARIRAAIHARYTQPENPSLPAVLTGSPSGRDEPPDPHRSAFGSQQ
ncbi:HAD hydrolase family protein (plasmid) [Paraburkholderia sprentiae WSM5005]|uniref:HAD hydrolase family protein n=1 Tax=Paraburkholderia sprentiae WSM5005 TaxID=754502 RepID=A0A1I9YUI5_9BURK|nr:HAD hydrolase family protein [Paraburkholderia sprentiae]APA89875.1 HAD hydrolase family protein [Paraburkholderia sprentiae WSM5005]